MISDRIFDDIPPQMKNLNIVIPILMYFLTINIEKCMRGSRGGGGTGGPDPSWNLKILPKKKR